MKRLWLDFESRSRLNLKEVGLDRYAKSPLTEVLMLAWAIDRAYPNLWLPCLGEPMPKELFEALMDAETEVCAWNYNFEKDILQYQMGITIPQERWYDPSITCANMSLPIGLHRAGQALNVSEQKTHLIGDERLTKVFSQLTKQLKRVLKKNPDAPAWYYKDWNSHPEQWEEFKKYCIQDVIAERDVDDAAIALNCPFTAGEKQAWLLDQRMNDAGVYIDKSYVINASKMAEEESNQILDEMKAVTELENPNSTQQLGEWLRERKYPYKSLDANHVEEALKLPFLKPEVRQILELKQKLGGSAYKKLEKILSLMGEDGRLRDQFVFHGAHTARWAGRGVQLQNLYKSDEAVSKFLDTYTRAIRLGKKIYSHNTNMSLVASTIRSAFAAAPGHKLVAGDLAQIESRVLAVLSGCQTMMDAYASGLDLYKDIMAFLLEKPYDQITKAERANGKVIILGCGFGMGWEHFIDYAATFGLTINEETAKKYVNAFREKYKEIPAYWEALNSAVVRAVDANVCIYVNGVVVDGKNPKVLKIKLPSGRCIHYHNPVVTMEPPPWGGPARKQVSYEAWDKRGKQVKRLYGGLICENVVQAIARDILLNGMLEAEKEGFRIIMTIHDEIVAEVLKSSGLGVEKLLECLRRIPEWAEGMGFVLAAEGWEGAYYKK